jgi:D-alanyl-D-alanine carboxypeptidase
MLLKPYLIVLYIFIFFTSNSQSLSAKEVDKQDAASDSTTSTYPLDFQKLIDNTVSKVIPGIVLRIETKNYRFLGSAGLADREKQIKMPTNALMYNASAGKTAIALLTSMLHEEGLLDINKSINHYLPTNLLSQIQHSELITLNHLLSHTSGIYNYLDDEAVYFEVINNHTKLKTDEHLLRFALNKPALFMPGEQFYYSDTGYLLVGLILDSVLGYHHSKALRQRILLPLGMDKTYYKGIEKRRNSMIPGYFTNNIERPIFDKNEIVNTKEIQESIGAADAPLISTVTELASLLKTTVIGSNIITKNMREMLFGQNSLNDMEDGWYSDNNALYGKGMFIETFKSAKIYHHPGVGLGYNTNNIYIPVSEISITAFANCGVSDDCDDNLHEMIIKILDALID